MTVKKSGFTLIELLVVISIIGMLSSIVAASVQSARVSARNTAYNAGIYSLNNALELYFSSFGRYPDASHNNFTQACLGFSDPMTFCINNYNPDGAEINAALAPYIDVARLKSSLVNSIMIWNSPSYACSNMCPPGGLTLHWLLEGENQKCGMGKSSGNLAGLTVCYLNK